MIKTVATNRYEKELKLMIKRGKDLNKLDYCCAPGILGH